MFDKSLRYSYVGKKSQRDRFLRALSGFLVFFLIYIGVTSFVFSMNVLENDAMQPTLRKGDRFIFTSRVFSLLSELGGDNSLFFRRGNIVLVDMSRGRERSVAGEAMDEVLRFFSAQRFGLQGEGQLYMKRVIGLPGDEITMTNFVIRVKPEGSSYNLTEFELSDRVYDVNIPRLPALWDETLPFSGNMERIVLKEDECFVLSDDRSNTNDSRTWGPIPVRYITGKALFRYWPLTRLGRP